MRASRRAKRLRCSRRRAPRAGRTRSSPRRPSPSSSRSPRSRSRPRRRRRRRRRPRRRPRQEQRRRCPVRWTLRGRARKALHAQVQGRRGRREAHRNSAAAIYKTTILPEKAPTFTPRPHEDAGEAARTRRAFPRSSANRPSRPVQESPGDEGRPRGGEARRPRGAALRGVAERGRQTRPRARRGAQDQALSQVSVVAERSAPAVQTLNGRSPPRPP